MNLEELKAKLSAGEITQDEYDQKVKELDDNKNTDISDEMKAYIAQLVQSETDKVRTKYAMEKKELNEKIRQLEEDKKKNLSEKELVEYEFQQKVAEFEKKQAEYLENSQKFEATQKMHAFGLDMKYLNFVKKADTPEEMELICKMLRENINADVEKAVNERFKSNGRDINGSGGASAKETDADFGRSLAQNRAEQTDASKTSTEYYFGKN